MFENSGDMVANSLEFGTCHLNFWVIRVLMAPDFFLNIREQKEAR